MPLLNPHWRNLHNYSNSIGQKDGKLYEGKRSKANRKNKIKCKWSKKGICSLVSSVFYFQFLFTRLFFVATWFHHLCLVSPALDCSHLCSVAPSCISSPCLGCVFGRCFILVESSHLANSSYAVAWSWSWSQSLLCFSVIVQAFCFCFVPTRSSFDRTNAFLCPTARVCLHFRPACTSTMTPQVSGCLREAPQHTVDPRRALTHSKTFHPQPAAGLTARRPEEKFGLGFFLSFFLSLQNWIWWRHLFSHWSDVV